MKTIAILQELGYPLSFSAQGDWLAVTCTEINEKSFVEAMMKQLSSTRLPQNIYIKDAAQSMFSLWSRGYETIDNIVRVMSTSSLQDEFTCECNKISQS